MSEQPGHGLTNQVDSEQRTWAMWCHLAAFATFVVPVGSVLGPLVVWLTKKQEYPLVDREGKKALNFQITVTICVVVVFIALMAAAFTETAAVVIVAAFFGFIVGIAWLVAVVMAAVRTNEGKDFNYPISIPFFR